MRAVQLSRFGGPEALDLVEIPKPSPRRGEVLVKVQAAGVNFFEVLMRQDRYAVTPQLPTVLGVEVAGVVEALGEGVAASWDGRRVAVPLFAAGRASGYAEYVTADAASLVPLPEELSFEDATALMVQGLTALHLVRRSPPAGRSVLVTAAGGGVGSLLVQLARRAGARRVIAAAGSQEKRNLASSLGADAGVDYSRSDWVERVRDSTDGVGADIIYDLIGGAVTRGALGALAPRGELVFGALGRFDLSSSEVNGMLFENQSLKGFALLPLLTPDALASDLTELFELAVRGDLKVTRGGGYPLEEAAAAHRALEERRSFGKVVLVP